MGGKKRRLCRHRNNAKVGEVERRRRVRLLQSLSLRPGLETRGARYSHTREKKREKERKKDKFMNPSRQGILKAIEGKARGKKSLKLQKKEKKRKDRTHTGGQFIKEGEKNGKTRRNDQKKKERNFGGTFQQRAETQKSEASRNG